jgi:hypothetical protein
MLNLVNWIFSKGFVDPPINDKSLTQSYDYKKLKSRKQELHLELVKYFIINKIAKETVDNIISDVLDKNKMNV